DIVAIAGGGYHALGLRADGTVAAWGSNEYGQTTVPNGLTNVIAIGASDYHSLALKADGTIVVWGAGAPSGLTNVTALGAGTFHSIAVVGGGRPFLIGPLASRFAIIGQNLNLRVTAQGANPLSYQWVLNGTNLPGATNATLI